jgi:hypothetical protein
MPWSFEWAAHLHGLYSREAFLELAALTGHRSAHIHPLLQSAAGASEEAAADPSFNELCKRTLASPMEAAAVVNFWQDAGPDLWFAKNSDFDRCFRERFLPWHELLECRHLPCPILDLG